MSSLIALFSLLLILTPYNTDDPGFLAEITSIYDGDTITTVVASDPMELYSWRQVKLRIAGANTPEVRGEERPQG